MATARHIAVKGGDVVLLVGALKGAFLLRGGAARTGWRGGLGTPVPAGAEISILPSLSGG